MKLQGIKWEKQRKCVKKVTLLAEIKILKMAGYYQLLAILYIV